MSLNSWVSILLSLSVLDILCLKFCETSQSGATPYPPVATPITVVVVVMIILAARRRRVIPSNTPLYARVIVYARVITALVAGVDEPGWGYFDAIYQSFSVKCLRINYRKS
jgi:hypothetical protein